MADYGIGSVDRALDVLAAFKDCGDPLGLADLARLTGVNKTTVLRICSSLERRGFVLRWVPDGAGGLLRVETALQMGWGQRKGGH